MPVIFHGSGGYGLGAALAGLGGALAGQQNAEEMRRRAAQESEEFELRRQATMEQIEASRARRELEQQEIDTTRSIREMVELGRQLDAAVAPDPVAQMVSENINASVNEADEFSSLPVAGRAEMANLQRGALFGGLWPKMSDVDKELAARSTARDFPKTMQTISQNIQEREAAAAMAEQDSRAQQMLASGIQFDQSQYATANNAEKRAAILDDAQAAVEEAQAFEQRKIQVVDYYNQKINAKPEEGDEQQNGLGFLLDDSQADKQRGLQALAGSMNEEQLKANMLQLELLIDPNGAVARYLSLEQENRALRQQVGSQETGGGPFAPMFQAVNQGGAQTQAGPAPATQPAAPTGLPGPENGGAPVQPGPAQPSTQAPTQPPATPEVQAAAREINRIAKSTPDKKEQKAKVDEYLRAHGFDPNSWPPGLRELVLQLGKPQAMPAPQMPAERGQMMRRDLMVEPQR